MASSRQSTAVAIPARDEEDCIGACLEALTSQAGASPDHIVVLANNCSDATVAVARAIRPMSGTTLHVLEEVLPLEQANAGMARRLAMARALSLVDPNGILLTTDADGQVDPDWLAATLAIMAGGVDVVAGWAELHPIDWGLIPARLHEDDARECGYDNLCDAIHALLDPDPFNPLPRHTQHSGASIAITAAAFVRCGGVPAVASGEDRALIAALRTIDARIRHAPEVRVTVSGRMIGRAAGGMADTIRRRMDQPDEMLDDRLEPAVACAHRAACRADLRRAYDRPDSDLSGMAHRLGVTAGWLSGAMQTEFFGQAWQAVEAAAPTLRRETVPVADLPRQVAEAEAILRGLRSRSDAAAWHVQASVEG